jgi:hypothetical protein
LIVSIVERFLVEIEPDSLSFLGTIDHLVAAIFFTPRPASCSQILPTNSS